ncbi:hypothetical protein TcCL_NonESM10982, partial [Trypanosoma cruzi]
RHLGQHCGAPPQISNSILGKVERVNVHRQLQDHVWVKIACLHDWSCVPQRTLFCGVRRGIPRSQRSLHVSSRQIRKLSLRRSVLHNVIVSNASCPRILTNRKARRESALAVIDATDQSKIMLPSGSSVKLLGVKAAISERQLAVIHAGQKTTRCFQSVRLWIYPSTHSLVKGRACFLFNRAATFCNPRITMSSGVRSICNTDRSILACRTLDYGAASNIAAKRARSPPR